MCRLEGGEALVPVGTDAGHPRHRVVERRGLEPVAELASPAALSAETCLTTAWRLTGSSREVSVAVSAPRPEHRHQAAVEYGLTDRVVDRHELHKAAYGFTNGERR